MTGWLEFVAALALFFSAHTLPVRPHMRRRLVERLGERGFLVGYSLLSLLILTWLIIAAGRTPYIELWPFETWQLWAPNVAMPIVCLLLALSIGAPNPLSFGGGDNGTFDPAHPGIAGVVRHPMLWALALWSVSHLVPNGDLAHAILFGLFAGFSLLGMSIIDRRKRRQMGDAAWAEAAHATSPWPLASLIQGRWRPTGQVPWARVSIAIVIYLVLLLSHGHVIGVSPWPQ